MLSALSRAGNVYGSPLLKAVDVTVSGPGSQVSFADSYTFDIAGKTRNDMGYVSKTFTFTAGPGNASTIRFASKDPPSTSCGAVLDDIVVAAGRRSHPPYFAREFESSRNLSFFFDVAWKGLFYSDSLDHLSCRCQRSYCDRS